MTIEMTLPVNVSENKLHLRESVATAKTEDGVEVEIALNADGTLLATIDLPGKGWRTYAITPAAFVEAVLKAEENRT